MLPGVGWGRGGDGGQVSPLFFIPPNCIMGLSTEILIYKWLRIFTDHEGKPRTVSFYMRPQISLETKKVTQKSSLALLFYHNSVFLQA